MSAEKPVLAVLTAAVLAAAVLAAASAAPAVAEEGRLLFAGDVLLSRQVEVEIDRTGRFPWERLAETFGKADLVFANLEGAVGSSADCRIGGETVSCTGVATRTEAGSFRPAPIPGVPTAVAALEECRAPLHQPLQIGDTLLRPMASLERHPSPIDGEDGVRPYVYEIGPRGAVARWRGSALAWPLVDATVLPGDPPLLCALHRRDAFLTLDVEALADRVALYWWNGFGFTGAEQAEALEACRAIWKR